MNFDFQFAMEILPKLLQASIITIFVTVLSFFFSLILGLALLLMRRSHRTADKVVRAIIEFIRSTPLLVQILFLYLVLPEYGIVLSPLQTGVLAMTLHYSCYMSEVYRAGFESVPKGQWEAATALNFTTAETYGRVIIPQMIPAIIPAAGNFLVYMFKDSPLLAAISLVELVFTAQMISADTFRYLEPMTLVGLIFLTMGLIAARGVAAVEKRIGTKWIGR